ncbi:MAG: hypothetical protein ABF301_05675 [Sulfurovum sp.]|jgi:hypothetical protein
MLIDFSTYNNILKEINRRGYDNLIIELFRLKDDVNVFIDNVKKVSS